MIVVKIELWPKGDAHAASSMGVLLIRNVGQPEGEVLDPDEYEYALEFQDHLAGKTLRSSLRHHRRRGRLMLVRKAVMEVLHG